MFARDISVQCLASGFGPRPRVGGLAHPAVGLITAAVRPPLGFRCESTDMADWTRTNFGDLRDVSPSDVQVQWRFAREALGSPELGVSRFTYDPGARMPWGHRHRVQEEIYVVVGGSGRAKLDDEVVELSVWDVLRVAPAVVRSFEAGPDGLDVICIGGRKPKGGDTERFEDFWQ
jgi:quercetin dioxygenase-like cupin family protein